MARLIPVRIRGLMMDDRSKSPIVLLQEEDGERVLPIWIGEAEARSIGVVLAGEKLERPMSHDLMLTMVRSLQGQVMGITISRLQDATFFAEIHIQIKGEDLLIDARPSDSIALALRAEAPILVAEDVLETGQASLAEKSAKDREADKVSELKKRLEDMDPGDFGKFGL